MARRKRRAKEASETLLAVVLGTIGILILVGLIGAYWYVKSSRPELDAETNCPKTGPRGIHVILFDRSDPISDQQAQRIRQAIDRYRIDAQFGTRFDLYTFDGDTAHTLQPKLTICALGKPEEANRLIQNPERVRQRYEARFSSVLNQTVDDLLRTTTQPTSPIIESIRAAAISSFGPIETAQVPLKLTLISDMVQHTKLVSQFQGDTKFPDMAASSHWITLQPRLKGADVDILYLLRPSALRNRAPIQNGSHQRFWEQLIAASGGRVNLIDPM
ncbi:MAG: hypothetical protein QOJ86_1478 [Bradyrhizobium sp.]|jgi:hypothetical protein|nr:hypothetical protein [Bradyrhizobium sp.]